MSAGKLSWCPTSIELKSDKNEYLRICQTNTTYQTIGSPKYCLLAMTNMNIARIMTV